MTEGRMEEVSEKKLSIIIPHYNSTELLKKLIQSIPQREDVEILLIDDNSTCGREELEKLAADRAEQLQLYFNEPGKNSAGACRNIGLEHAEGKWLLFADADDYFMPEFYEKVAAYFDSDADIVWFVPTSWNLSTNRVDYRHVRYEKLVRDFLTGGLREEIRLRYHEESPCSKLVRRELVAGHGIRFDTTMVANDIMFSMRCAYAAKKVAASEEVIYCVTKQKGTLTTAVNPDKFYIRLGVFLEKYRFLKAGLSRKEWKMVDLLGRPYIKLAKNYGLNRKQIFRLYITLIGNGVRIDISRKWTPAFVLRKIREKLLSGEKRSR